MKYKKKNKSAQRRLPMMTTLPKRFRQLVHSYLIQDCSHLLDDGLVDTLVQALRENRDPKKSIGPEYGLQSISEKGADARHYAARELVCRFQSKYVSTVDADKLHSEAVQRYVDIDATLVSSTLGEGSIRRLRRTISALMGKAPTWVELGNHARHGPGSSRNIPYSKRHGFFKYRMLPYECSPTVLPELVNLVHSDDRWQNAVSHALWDEFGIMLRHPSWDDGYDIKLPFITSTLCRAVRSNKLTTVPKDSSKRRTIAKEPTFNMFYQLGMHEVLSRRLRRKTPINIRSVELNRQLARLGSIHGGLRSPATIDLSEASDRISLELVRTLLPLDWLKLLESVRSEFIELHDRSLLLNKYASMGNGTTFVVQTIIFYSLCIEAYELARHPFDRDTVVFGDDIIVPRLVVPHLLNLLGRVGSVVNTDKSFWDGPVRETCGREYYCGTDIRPVFFRKDYDNDLQSLIALRNLLWLWQLRVDVPLTETINYIDSFLINVPSVPANENYSSGLFTEVWAPLKEGVHYKTLVFTERNKPLPIRCQTDFEFGKLCSHLKPQQGATRTKTIRFNKPDVFFPVPLLEDSPIGGSVFAISGTGTAKVRCSTAPFRYTDLFA